MEKNNNHSTKILWGLVIGGVVGTTAAYLMQAHHRTKSPVLNKIGMAFCEIGHVLEKCEIEDLGELKHEIQNVVHQKDHFLSHLFDWISNGVELLHKIKNGG